MRGEGDTGWRSGERGAQRGHRGPPAPTRNQHRQTGVPAATPLCAASCAMVPGTVRGWRAGEVLGLVSYVKWADRTRGGKEWRGTHAIRDLVHRVVRLRDKGPEMAQCMWRRMLGESVPGVDLQCPKERGRKRRVRMLRELLQREGW